MLCFSYSKDSDSAGVAKVHADIRMELPETKSDNSQEQHLAADQQKIYNVFDMVDILLTDKETNEITDCIRGVVIGKCSVENTKGPHYYVMGEDEFSKDILCSVREVSMAEALQISNLTDVCNLLNKEQRWLGFEELDDQPVSPLDQVALDVNELLSFAICLRAVFVRPRLWVGSRVRLLATGKVGVVSEIVDTECTNELSELWCGRSVFSTHRYIIETTSPPMEEGEEGEEGKEEEKEDKKAAGSETKKTTATTHARHELLKICHSVSDELRTTSTSLSYTVKRNEMNEQQRMLHCLSLRSRWIKSEDIDTVPLDNTLVLAEIQRFALDDVLLRHVYSGEQGERTNRNESHRFLNALTNPTTLLGGSEELEQKLKNTVILGSHWELEGFPDQHGYTKPGSLPRDQVNVWAPTMQDRDQRIDEFLQEQRRHPKKIVSSNRKASSAHLPGLHRRQLQMFDVAKSHINFSGAKSGGRLKEFAPMHFMWQDLQYLQTFQLRFPTNWCDPEHEHDHHATIIEELCRAKNIHIQSIKNNRPYNTMLSYLKPPAPLVMFCMFDYQRSESLKVDAILIEHVGIFIWKVYSSHNRTAFTPWPLFHRCGTSEASEQVSNQQDSEQVSNQQQEDHAQGVHFLRQFAPQFCYEDADAGGIHGLKAILWETVSHMHEKGRFQATPLNWRQRFLHTSPRRQQQQQMLDQNSSSSIVVVSSPSDDNDKWYCWKCERTYFRSEDGDECTSCTTEQKGSYERHTQKMLSTKQNVLKMFSSFAQKYIESQYFQMKSSSPEWTCVTGDSVVRLANGSTALACEIKVGDVMSPENVRVIAVTTQRMRDETLLCRISKSLVITPVHPLKLFAAGTGTGTTTAMDKEWVFPKDVADVVDAKSLGQTESLLVNFVLEQGGTRLVTEDGVEFVTLGHGMQQRVVKHCFWGTSAVVNVLRKREDWPNCRLEGGVTWDVVGDVGCGGDVGGS